MFNLIKSVEFWEIIETLHEITRNNRISLYHTAHG